MKNNLPNPGDIIYTKRNKHTSFGIPIPEYKHYGIYIGNYQVIHFSGPRGHETDADLAEIIQTSLRGFLKGDSLFIQTDSEITQYDNTLNPFPASKVIERAKSMLGQGKGEYNLKNNNCEHFANWCRYDKKFCRQIIEIPIRIAKNTAKEAIFVIAEGISKTMPLPSNHEEIYLIKGEKK